MRFVLNSTNFTAKFVLILLLILFYLLEVILNLALKFTHTGRKIATSHNQNHNTKTHQKQQFKTLLKFNGDNKVAMNLIFTNKKA